MSIFIDGVPMKMITSMLPFKTRLNPFIYTNIHLLNKFENKHKEDYTGLSTDSALSKKAQLNIIETLYDFIKKLSHKESSEWKEYYQKTNYSNKAFEHKSQIINRWLSEIDCQKIIDIGGNDGTFVRKIEHQIDHALVCDVDANAVDANFVEIKKNKEQHIVPFVIDILNPTPSIGFDNKERFSFLNRICEFNPDATLALAVIHHISLSGNVPFDKSAKYFASFSKYLIIEFPKREDSYVQRLLKQKMDFEEYFNFYNQENFESSYSLYFEIIEKINLIEGSRIMYFLKTK